MSVKKSNPQDNLESEELTESQASAPEGEEATQASLNESGNGTIRVTN